MTKRRQPLPSAVCMDSSPSNPSLACLTFALQPRRRIRIAAAEGRLTGRGLHSPVDGYLTFLPQPRRLMMPLSRRRRQAESDLRKRRGSRTDSGDRIVEGHIGRTAGDDVESLGGVVVDDVSVTEQRNPPGGIVVNAVEVRSLTSSNRIRKQSAADRVVVDRIEGAAGICWRDFTRIDVDASLRRASDNVVIHGAAGAAAPQVDSDASAPDVVVGDFGARVAPDR